MDREDRHPLPVVEGMEEMSIHAASLLNGHVSAGLGKEQDRGMGLVMQLEMECMEGAVVEEGEEEEEGWAMDPPISVDWMPPGPFRMGIINHSSHTTRLLEGMDRILRSRVLLIPSPPRRRNIRKRQAILHKHRHCMPPRTILHIHRLR